MKEHFVNIYGLTGYSIAYICIVSIVLIFLGADEYNEWLCDNYEQVTGFDSKYINWDGCYVKDSDNVFIRYDQKYKSVK
jgi:hypothetical protein